MRHPIGGFMFDHPALLLSDRGRFCDRTCRQWTEDGTSWSPTYAAALARQRHHHRPPASFVSASSVNTGAPTEDAYATIGGRPAGGAVLSDVTTPLRPRRRVVTPPPAPPAASRARRRPVARPMAKEDELAGKVYGRANVRRLCGASAGLSALRELVAGLLEYQEQFDDAEADIALISTQDIGAGEVATGSFLQEEGAATVLQATAAENVKLKIYTDAASWFHRLLGGRKVDNMTALRPDVLMHTVVNASKYGGRIDDIEGSDYLGGTLVTIHRGLALSRPARDGGLSQYDDQRSIRDGAEGAARDGRECVRVDGLPSVMVCGDVKA